MIHFVCFKWKPPFNYRSTFTAEHVNVLRSMLERHTRVPHRLVCITDDPAGIDHRVECIPLSEWDERNLSDVPSPHAGANPSCYRRLRLWDDSTCDLIGRRVCSIDLDCVIVDDITPLVNRAETWVLWGDYVNPSTHYNGSMQLISPGAAREVYTLFDPIETPKQTIAKGFHGSDQGWLSMFFGAPDPERAWTAEDGVLSYRVHCRKGMNWEKRENVALPDGARIVFFHGPHDPWLPETQAEAPWIKEHYR